MVSRQHEGKYADLERLEIVREGTPIRGWVRGIMGVRVGGIEAVQ